MVRESQVQAQVLLLGPHRRLVRDASQVLSGGAALDEVQLHLRFLDSADCSKGNLQVHESLSEWRAAAGIRRN